MTIRECMEAARENAKQLTPKNGGPAWDEVIADTVDIWSNYSCLGYCVAAAQRMNLDGETTKELISQLHRVFDDITVAEAEQIYMDY